MAVDFESEEAAFQYLEENLESMEAPPVRNTKQRIKPSKPLVAIGRHPRSPLPLFVTCTNEAGRPS